MIPLPFFLGGSRWFSVALGVKSLLSGPLELAELIGLDTCLSIIQVLYEGLSDSKYQPCPLLVRHVEAGWLGRRTNRRFYDYTVTPRRPTR